MKMVERLLVVVAFLTRISGWNLPCDAKNQRTCCTTKLAAEGIQCDPTGSVVTGMTLNNRPRKIGGTIPGPDLALLKNCTNIYLNGNNMDGTIPSELGEMEMLDTLFISFNHLTGTIPSELCQLKKLNALYLGNNKLTGTFPNCLGELPYSEIQLMNNGLTGTVPETLCSTGAPHRAIDFSYNKFTGEIPTCLAKMGTRNGGRLGGIYLEANDFACPVANYSTWAYDQDYYGPCGYGTRGASNAVRNCGGHRENGCDSYPFGPGTEAIDAAQPGAILGQSPDVTHPKNPRPVGVGPDDGNPHHWDRNRRCDIDYDPPCKPCEGRGGIPWSDANKDIQLVQCEVLKNATDVPVESRVPPLFPSKFSCDIWEVLIDSDGSHFPPPTSIGNHTFNPELGKWYYDFYNDKLGPVTRFDYNAGKMGKDGPWPLSHKKNNTVSVLHWRTFMFIMIGPAPPLNVAKEDFCVCAEPPVGPVVPDWAMYDNRYVGRERIFIEYIWEWREVDHWQRGPHNIYMDLHTRMPIRQWQPFNGLEVYDNFDMNVDMDSHFAPLPSKPKICTGIHPHVPCPSSVG